MLKKRVKFGHLSNSNLFAFPRRIKWRICKLRSWAPFPHEISLLAIIKPDVENLQLRNVHRILADFRFKTFLQTSYFFDNLLLINSTILKEKSKEINI